MTRLCFQLTTREPLIISQNTASTLTHLSLPFIPGSVLQGAIATRLLPVLSADEQDALLYSGQCRIFSAYPLQQGQIVLPMPASWQQCKGDESDTVINLAAAAFSPSSGRRYRPCSSNFISDTCVDVTVPMTLTTRTAIDRQTARAADGQIYNYTAIRAGQTFGVIIECTHPSLAERLRHELGGEWLLGRARSSEFGRVVLTPARLTTTWPAPAEASTLVIWCLSDLLCRDRQGLPTLAPEADRLHPALSGTLCPQRSVIRERRVRPFNRARGGPDSEQIRIAAGSVLVYTLTSPASAALLLQIEQQGAGDAREQGLGWLAINPPWSQQREPCAPYFDALTVSVDPVVQPESGHQSGSAPPPASRLTAWLQQRHRHQQHDTDQQAEIWRLLACIVQDYQALRRYANAAPQQAIGPNRHQWRQLEQVLRSPDPARWVEQAFTDAHAPCRERAQSPWGEQVLIGGQLLSLSQRLQNHLADKPIALLRQLLEVVCAYDLSLPAGLNACEALRRANDPSLSQPPSEPPLPGQAPQDNQGAMQ
ncbi:hypothetical protein KSI86_16415 [Dickeya oryzae]|uniref:hypothetical protein n=1 Tax=Dickeya oryzae TaxID=1240404 RepID=UPI00209842B1|nr:hypothetical protein [Dickeya oryzae]MCO7255744.1 hypothetical protein [Dickeya oryzae]